MSARARCALLGAAVALSSLLLLGLTTLGSEPADAAATDRPVSATAAATAATDRPVSAAARATAAPKAPPAKVTRLDVWLEKGTASDAARAIIETRLRQASLALVDLTAITKPRPGWVVRVAGYHATPFVTSVLEAGELLAVFLVDDANPLWSPVGPAVAAAAHVTETLDKWHTAHDLRAPALPILTAALALVPAPPKRRFLVGAGPEGAAGVRAVLVVDPPPLVGAAVTDAHVTAGAAGAGRAIYATLRPADVRRYADLTAVHTGARLALALGDELLQAAKVKATTADGTFLIPMGAAPGGAAEALAARLRATSASSGLRVAKVTLE